MYDFSPKGNLLQFLDAKSGRVLNFLARLRISHGVAKGKIVNTSSLLVFTFGFVSNVGTHINHAHIMS